MRSAKRRTSTRRTSARVGGSRSRSPRMSVMKPGVSSSAPPKMTSTPSSTSRAGGRAGLQRVVEAPPRRPALRAHQQRAEDRVGDQERDRPPHADQLADLDEQRQLGDRDDDEDQDEEEAHLAPRTLTKRATRLSTRDRRLAVEADELDQRADLRLRARAAGRARPSRAQALREHREVDHQRRVGEAQLARGRRRRRAARAARPRAHAGGGRSSSGPRPP